MPEGAERELGRAVAGSNATKVPAAAGLPIVVDMDGYLVRADLEAETAIADLERRIRSIAETLTGIGSAASRSIVPQARQPQPVDPRTVAEFARKGLDVSRLPLDEQVVAELAASVAAGRQLHLVTACAQEIADAVAARIGGFASATGATTPALVAQRFPDGFSYAGRNQPMRNRAAEVIDSHPAAAPSRNASRPGGSAETAKTATNRPSASGLPASSRTWIRALRCHQWSKNALVFVPLVLGHAYSDPVAVAASIAGFLLLSLLASGTYLINDLLDLDADRRHATKSARPLARGDIRAGTAIIVACVLIAGSLAAAIQISPLFFAALGGYLVTTLAYSLYLKRLHLIDVFVLAALFTFRIAMGVALAGVTPSPWLLTFTMFFFLSLSLAKRHVEIVNAADRGETHIPGRDYRTSDIPLTIALGVACNAVAMLVIFLYLAFDATPAGFYHQPYWLWAAGFVVFLWSLRIWGLSHRGLLDADPVAFAIKDRTSIVLGLIVAFVFWLAL